MTNDELKHLDYIQSAISRMASAQFQIKGWSITLATALLTLFANSLVGTSKFNPYYLLIAVVPTMLFWLMDTRFLANERRLRRIYTEVSKHNEDIAPFDIPVHRYRDGKCSFICCMFAFGNILIYLLPILAFVAGFVLALLL